MRSVLSGKLLKEQILKSIELLCGTVKDSLGPMGRNVLINVSDRDPFITNDGVTIAENITSNDVVVQTILEILKEASLKTNEVVGDGTTTTLVLLESILKESYQQENVDQLEIKKQLENCLSTVLEHIQTLSRKPTRKDYFSIATVAANDSFIGRTTSDVFLKVKKKQCIFLRESKTEKTTYEIMNGYRLDVKVPEEYFLNQSNLVMENCHVIYLDYKVERIEELASFINQSTRYQENYIILCEGYNNEVASYLVDYFYDKKCFIVIASWMMYNAWQDEIMEDIRALEEDGVLSSVNISSSNIILHRSKNTKKRRDTLLKRYEEVEEDYQKEMLMNRIAMLHHGFATIYVGGFTTTEKREKIMRFEDALCAMEMARTGIVPGGGICFYQASDSLKEDCIGSKILKQALKVPFSQILSNANLSCDEIISNIKNANYEMLYNVKTNDYERVDDTSVIEPAAVVSYSLKNAVSIAGMILSINHLVINDFQEKHKDYEM